MTTPATGQVTSPAVPGGTRLRQPGTRRLTAASMRIETPVRGLDVAAYTVPTDAPEADGTFAWQATTIVVVHAYTAGEWGIGYTYADTATARLITDMLAPIVTGQSAMSPQGCWQQMVHAIRNLGRPGICSMAISTVDVALWDLKARLLGVPLCTLLGQVHDGVEVYGSGGFTSYPMERLADQLGSWAAQGMRAVKMKIGSDPVADPERVRIARQAIGTQTELFVDANGAYTRSQALAAAETFHAQAGVRWFEEPVSSDDLEGLRLLRDRAPAGVAIAAGEYGYDLAYFERMLQAGAVDVLQADITRCGGITELQRIAALCSARSMPLSLHCAPAIHVHPALSLPPLLHLEYFHDHARIEQLLFDGAPLPSEGALSPDLSRPGCGLELKRAEAQRYAV